MTEIDATELRALDKATVLRFLTLLFRKVELNHSSKFIDVFIDASRFQHNKSMVTTLLNCGYLKSKKGTHLAFTERGLSFFINLWNNLKNNNESITQET